MLLLCEALYHARIHLIIPSLQVQYSPNMERMCNAVQLFGNLGQDVELRKFEKGIVRGTTTIAINLPNVKEPSW